MTEIQKDYQKDIKKIIIISPSEVDKASFIKKVFKNYSGDYIHGEDKIEYLFKDNEKEINIPVFDICQWQRFPDYLHSINFNSSVVILVYAIDIHYSLFQIKITSQIIKNDNPKNCKYILLGIKNMKGSEREISRDSGEEILEKNELDAFFEISDENDNIDNCKAVFEKAAEILLKEENEKNEENGKSEKNENNENNKKNENKEKNKKNKKKCHGCFN